MPVCRAPLGCGGESGLWSGSKLGGFGGCADAPTDGEGWTDRSCEDGQSAYTGS